MTIYDWSPAALSRVQCIIDRVSANEHAIQLERKMNSAVTDFQAEKDKCINKQLK